MHAATIAARLGAVDVLGLLSSRDDVEVLVGVVTITEAWEQHIQFVEAQRKNLAVEISNAMVKAQGG